MVRICKCDKHTVELLTINNLDKTMTDKIKVPTKLSEL